MNINYTRRVGVHFYNEQVHLYISCIFLVIVLMESSNESRARVHYCQRFSIISGIRPALVPCLNVPKLLQWTDKITLTTHEGQGKLWSIVNLMITARLLVSNKCHLIYGF